MIVRATEDELRLLAELRQGGIPLDEAVMKEMKTARRGLSVCQTGNIVLNCVFDLDWGGAGYMLSAAICNDNDQVRRAQEPRLEIPWAEWDFCWLENPRAKIPREYDYSFPPPGPAGYDPVVVLNHRLRPACRLNPDGFVEGLLLGVGQASIPDQYVDRQSVRMRLSIFDGRGNCYGSDVILGVSRGGRLRRQQAKESLLSRREVFGKHTLAGAARARKVAV